MAKKQKVGSGELNDELNRMRKSFEKNMTEKWGEALVRELIPKGVELLRKPPVQLDDALCQDLARYTTRWAELAKASTLEPGKAGISPRRPQGVK